MKPSGAPTPTWTRAPSFFAAFPPLRSHDYRTPFDGSNSIVGTLTPTVLFHLARHQVLCRLFHPFHRARRPCCHRRRRRHWYVFAGAASNPLKTHLSSASAKLSALQTPRPARWIYRMLAVSALLFRRSWLPPRSRPRPSWRGPATKILSPTFPSRRFHLIAIALLSFGACLTLPPPRVVLPANISALKQRRSRRSPPVRIASISDQPARNDPSGLPVNVAGLGNGGGDDALGPFRRDRRPRVAPIPTITVGLSSPSSPIPHPHARRNSSDS